MFVVFLRKSSQIMKINPIFFICALLLSFSVQAQNIKVTLNDGTVTEGEIVEYSTLSKTPDRIKVLSNGKVETYDPSQVSGFELDGDKYISRVVDLNINTQDAQNLTDFSELEWVLKQVFLKVLVEGTVGLYTYHDSRLHYFATKGNTIVELVKLKRLNKSTVNQYVGQLNILFSDCETQQNTDNIQFNTISLRRAVMEYNQCVSGGSEYVQENDPADISFYILGGYTITSYSISADGVFSGYQVDPESDGSFTFGVGFDVNLLRKSRKLLFYNEVLLQNYKFGGFTRNQISPEQYIDYQFNVDLDYLEITNALRYNFGAEPSKANIFGNIGINHGIQVSNTSSEYSVNVFRDTETRTEREPLGGDIANYRISFSVGLGLRYKFAMAEVRYGFSPRISTDPITTTTTPLNFLMAFKVF